MTKVQNKPLIIKRVADIPTLEQARPEYGRLLAKQTALHAERSALSSEADGLAVAISSGAADAGGKVARAAAIIDGTVEVASDRDRLAVIRKRISDDDLALAALPARIALERAEGSAVIRAAVSPFHTHLVRNVANALAALQVATAEYEAFAEKLNDSSISWSELHPMHFHAVGPPGRHGMIADFFRECVANGFLKASDVPLELWD